jgi:FHS family Na+ dependent glucose MFS transporter 1
VTLAQISFLFTSSSLGYFVGSAGGGRLFDRFKGHPIMLVAVIFFTAVLFLIPLTPDFYALLVLLFIFGLGQGLLDVGANVNLLWVFQARVGPYMNSLHFFFGVGAFLSPIILHTVMNLAGGELTWPFWVLALLSLPGLIGLSTLSSPTNPEKEEIENDTQTNNTRLLVAMVLLFFLYVGVEGGFGGWIFTYALETQLATETSASYINSLFWGALTLGRLLTVPLARKIKPAPLLLGNFLLAILFLGLILVFPHETWMLWVGSAGLGFALSSVFPTLMVLGESRMKISGKVTGYFFLGSSLGGMLVPMGLGQIFEYIGSAQIMMTLFILLLLGLAVLISVIYASNRIGEKSRV